MPKASDNVFPRFLISEGGSTATPAAGRVTVYAKADGLLYSKDDAGSETALGGGGAGLGAWTGFTPVWSSLAGTPPTTGNATLTARYKMLDSKTCLFYMTLIFGSTSAAGTGSWTFTLPVTAASNGEQLLTGHILDSGTDSKLAVARIASGGTTIYQIVPEGGNAVIAGSPMTWATGDRIDLSGFIEVA